LSTPTGPITSSNKWKKFWVGYLIFCVCYMGTEYFAKHARILPLSQLDTAIPFLEWTVWIYLSQFLLVFLAAWKINDSKILSVTFCAMALASIVSFIVFIAMPTRLPRVFHCESTICRVMFSCLYLTDSDSNCFPSLHVSISTLASYGLYKSAKKLSGLFLLWSILIWISTLTTKQHCVIDVVGGIIMATVSIWIIKFLLIDRDSRLRNPG